MNKTNLIKVFIFSTLLFALPATANSIDETQRWEKQGKAVALLFNAKSLYQTPEGYGLYTRTLGEMHKLCPDERLFSEKAVYGACTGFLIKNNLLITSPSCVKGPSSCESLRIYFGFENGKSDLTNISEDKIYRCIGVDGNLVNNVGGAFRVITLDRPVTDVEPLMVESRAVQTDEEVFFISHLAGAARSYGKSRVFETSEKWNRFRAGLPSMVGSEGAPVFSQATGNVVGVYTSNLNSHFYNNPYRGCTETKICEGSACFLEIIGSASLFSFLQ